MASATTLSTDPQTRMYNKRCNCNGIEDYKRLESPFSKHGLVVVFAWIGAMKFTGIEAQGIQPLVAHSSLMSWMYKIVTVQQFSNGLGVVEIVIAALIALRPWSAKISAVGSGIAVLVFLTTLTFLFSTPGWEPSLGGSRLSRLQWAGFC